MKTFIVLIYIWIYIYIYIGLCSERTMGVWEEDFVAGAPAGTIGTVDQKRALRRKETAQ
jgi:hypothetical protein